MASAEKHEEKEKQETGADVMIRALLKSGIGVCFANPGTTEMPLVASLDAIKGVRCILGLHENVVTGAADGYARMSGKPAITLLHLGVGFANGTTLEFFS
jgi:acetolactate synthase-1/2/3 large subunit